ncbi:MAG: hypothetical protein AAF517_24905, partial [Planctomycetota bacterium]
MKTIPKVKWLALCVWTLCLIASKAPAEDQWVVYEGGEGPGKGKHIVFLSGDEEYRTEEGYPQLG